MTLYCTSLGCISCLFTLAALETHASCEVFFFLPTNYKRPNDNHAIQPKKVIHCHDKVLSSGNVSIPTRSNFHCNNYLIILTESNQGTCIYQWGRRCQEDNNYVYQDYLVYSLIRKQSRKFIHLESCLSR